MHNMGLVITCRNDAVGHCHLLAQHVFDSAWTFENSCYCDEICCWLVLVSFGLVNSAHYHILFTDSSIVQKQKPTSIGEKQHLVAYIT